jgi:hypothetical protein
VKNNSALTPPTRFLPFEKFHIAPITDFAPDALKSSAKICREKYNDREPIKHSTCLNYIVKRLGFKGGFSEFKKFHFDNLQRFMAKNGLQKHKDLVIASYTPAIIRLNTDFRKALNVIEI